MSFWRDNWLGERTLGEVFPILFRTARNKDAFVGEYTEYEMGNIFGR